MERSDTQPDLPKREEIEGDEPTDRMMRMVLSLRAELYDLYAKHQALLDENARLRATNVVQIKLKENKDALPTGTERKDEPVLCGEREDGTETLNLPTTEDACRAADAGVVSGDADKRPLTPMPNTPKFPLQPAEFRPMSPSEHGLADHPPNAESEQP
jgi:hypothetical protein